MSVVYTDPDYAHSRLPGTIVFYEGSPVYVSEILEDGDAYVTPCIAGANYFTVSLEALDLTPPRLGYVNHPTSCAFFVRSPQRQWRQGLRMSQLRNLSGRTRGVELFSPQLLNCLRNLYPPVEECLDRIDCGEANEQAFARNFSVGSIERQGYALRYKMVKVGHVIAGESPRPVLAEKFSYLQELCTTVFGSQEYA